ALEAARNHSWGCNARYVEVYDRSDIRVPLMGRTGVLSHARKQTSPKSPFAVIHSFRDARGHCTRPTPKVFPSSDLAHTRRGFFGAMLIALLRQEHTFFVPTKSELAPRSASPQEVRRPDRRDYGARNVRRREQDHVGTRS